MGRRYSAVQWAVWVREQGESGATVAAFCDSIGVSVNSFYLWRRKLQSVSRRADGTRRRGPEGFVQLAVSEPVLSGRVEIELACGAVLRVPREGGLLEQVMGLLLAAGTGGQQPGGASC